MVTADPSDITRLLGIAAVIGFLGLLVWYAPRQGYNEVRLSFLAALGGLAIIGAYGLVQRSPWLTAAAASTLAIAAFFQAILWVVIAPLVAVLVLAAVVDGYIETTNSDAAL